MREDHNRSGDMESLELFAVLMIQHGFNCLLYGEKGDGFDITGARKGVVYLFNLKQRNFPSTKYNDLVLDKADFDALKWAQGNNLGSKAAYVQFFTDGYVFISNAKGWEETTLDCPRTTRFGDNETVRKTIMRKPQDARGVKRIDLGKVSLDGMMDIYGLKKQRKLWRQARASS